jgi:hypothetical protein
MLVPDRPGPGGHALGVEVGDEGVERGQVDPCRLLSTGRAQVEGKRVA